MSCYNILCSLYLWHPALLLFLLPHWRHFFSPFAGWPYCTQHLNIIILKCLVLGFLFSILIFLCLSPSCYLISTISSKNHLYPVDSQIGISSLCLVSYTSNCLLNIFPLRCHIAPQIQKRIIAFDLPAPSSPELPILYKYKHYHPPCYQRQSNGKSYWFGSQNILIHPVNRLLSSSIASRFISKPP